MPNSAGGESSCWHLGGWGHGESLGTTHWGVIGDLMQACAVNLLQQQHFLLQQQHFLQS